MKLGGIEAGGTKMVCAIGDEQGKIFDRAVFPTETPESTVPKMIAYFQDKGIEALGIGCFGPVDLNKKISNLRLYYQHSEAGMEIL
mgnify:CR=1 FL=1